jgi:hypothetical protein
MAQEQFRTQEPPVTFNTLPLTPPFALEGLTARVFPLRSSLDSLQRFCNSYLNFLPPEIGRFRAFVPYTYMMIIDYGRLAPVVANLGWFAQREIFFAVPVQWYKVINGQWQFHDWAVMTPYIFVDNDLSVPLGRTVFGWQKTIAQITPTVSNWIHNPIAPVSVATVSTMVFPELYQGRRLESRVLMEVERDGPITGVGIPLDTQNPVAPWMIASNLAQAMAGFGRDALGMLSGMGIMPMGSTSRPDNYVTMMRKMAEDTSPLRQPPTYHTINLKQFRRTGVPEQYCYQAVTDGPMRFSSFNGGALMGEDRIMLGDTSGGFSIKLSEWASLPIIDAFGLEVARRWQGDGVSVALLKPVMPFWYNVNMEYLAGMNLAWRIDDGRWRGNDGRPIEVTTKPVSAAVEADDKLFNTTLGSAVDSVAGPFQFSGTTIRVLPLLARREHLDAYLDRTLNSALADCVTGQAERFSLWAAPNDPTAVIAETAAEAKEPESGIVDGADPKAGEYGYVYLTASSFRDVTSKTNNIGDWAKFEVAFLVPVKRETWNATTGKFELAGVGLVPAFTYVDDTTAAIARSEVLGIVTSRAVFDLPASSWMSERGTENDRRQMLLRVNGEVLPAVGEGQGTRMGTLLDIIGSDTTAGISRYEGRVTADRWAAILVDEQARKKQTAHDNEDAIYTARHLALQILGNHVPVSLYTMKQFRDVTDPDNACYQAIISVPRVLDEVMDIHEIEQPMTVRIHEFPTEPIVATLGLIGKLVRDDGAGMVYAMQPVRPFSLNVTMDEELGIRLMSRAGKLDWMYSTELPSPLLTNDPFGGVSPSAEKALDEGDPRRLEKIVRVPRVVTTSGLRSLTASNPVLADARAALEAIDPQMIVESILSREWGNWSTKARWRKGRRTIVAAYEDMMAGVDAAHKLAAEKAFYQETLKQCLLPLGGRPMDIAQTMIDRILELESWNLKLDGPWSTLVGWGLDREYGWMYPSENRPPKPSRDEMFSTIKAFLDCLGAIAGLEIVGVPGTPDRSIDGAAIANEDRLAYLIGNVLSELKSIVDRDGATAAQPDDFQLASDEAFRLRAESKEAVALARQRVQLQREAVFNQLAKGAQKPDFCVRRDSAGPDRDRLFPIAESWDDDWYYGPRLLDHNEAPR